MRYGWILLATFLLAIGIALTLRGGWGKRSLVRYSRYPDERQFPEFWEKFYLVNPLGGIGVHRAYTPKEMEILRWAVQDESRQIRVEALAAFSRAYHDPQQRREAIQWGIKSLKDPH
ncbi:MAG: hypothetical protein RJAPGHWK_000760 [Candidatus Fervidibacter sp.]